MGGREFDQAPLRPFDAIVAVAWLLHQAVISGTCSSSSAQCFEVQLDH